MRLRKRKKTRIIDYNIEKEAEFLNNKNVRESIFKIAVVLLIICLNSTALSEIGRTLSYFSDTEQSLGNTYNAGTLDFLLESPSDFSPLVFKSDKLSVRNIDVVKIGNLDFQYNIEAVKISGDDELCDILQLEALLESDIKYQGTLIDLNLDPMVIIGEDGRDNWVFNLTLPDLSPQELKDIRNKTCQFEFIFKGQQIDCPECSLGFLDVETIVNNISTGDWNPEVEVIYPNGGEVWYMVPPGSEVPGFLGTYEIRWTALSPVYDANNLQIDIWFCKASGNDCFHKITSSGTTENDGNYWWTIPYNFAFITDEARMKIVAYDPEGFMGEDFSDEDFCPPMLNQEDVARMMLLLKNVDNNFLEELGITDQLESDLPAVPTAQPLQAEPELEPVESPVDNQPGEEQIIEEKVVEESAESFDPAPEGEPEGESEEPVIGEQEVIEELPVVEEESQLESESEPQPEIISEEQEVVEEQLVEEEQTIEEVLVEESTESFDPAPEGEPESESEEPVIEEQPLVEEELPVEEIIEEEISEEVIEEPIIEEPPVIEETSVLIE